MAKDKSDTATGELFKNKGGRPRMPSTQVRVPLGCLEEVQAVIAKYRAKHRKGGS